MFDWSNISSSQGYADDLDDLSTQTQIREKTEKVWQTVRREGLEINAPITKVMCINTILDAPLTIAGETLECVDSRDVYSTWKFKSQWEYFKFFLSSRSQRGGTFNFNYTKSQSSQLGVLFKSFASFLKILFEYFL